MVLAFESIGQRRLPPLMTFLSFTIALVYYHLSWPDIRQHRLARIGLA